MNDIRIGIISADVNTPKFNYGAILHTWAFEEFLKKNGYSNYENINYQPETLVHQHRLFPILDLITHTHRKLSLYYTSHYYQYLKKYKKIKSFCDRQMVNTKKIYTYKNITKQKMNYDLLIAEDDVIWSPNFLCESEVVDKTFFLAHDNMKTIRKISYAPSMSDCHFHEKDYPLIQDYLSGFERISVRETYAVDFLKSKLNINAVAVLDAVFLLDAVDYNNIISVRFKKEPDYLLLYLPAEDNALLREKATEYANKKGLQIIEVSNKIVTHGNVVGDCGVEDFLSAIKYASIIFTNSFHALCFSLIFEKDFYMFSRGLNGKNKDLCNLLNIASRYCPEEITGESIDYSIIRQEINKQQKRSRDWLLSALKGE